MGTQPKITSAISPASVLMLAMAQQTGTPTIPEDINTLKAILLDPRSGNVRTEFRSVLPDERHALIHVVLKGGMPRDEQKAIVAETEQIVAEAGFADVEVVVTGGPPLDARMEDLIAKNMGLMFMASIILMFVILLIVFRVGGFFTWRWLALGVVGIGLIYTFGTIGLIGVSISMVSMAALPILIGLGVDYPIQLHNRYDENIRAGARASEAVRDSITHVGPAIAMALVALLLGFAALLFSPVPMIRDFGIMLIIGAIACYLTALFVTPAILEWRKAGASQKVAATPKSGGILERWLRKLTSGTIKRPLIIIPIALALTIVGIVYDHRVGTETDAANMMSENVPVVANFKTLQEVAGGVSGLSLFVEADDVTDPGVLAWMLQVEGFARTNPDGIVGSTTSIADLVLQANGGQMPQTSAQVRQILSAMPRAVTSNLVNEDFTSANVSIGLTGGLFEAGEIKALQADLAQYAADDPGSVAVTVTGTGVVNYEMLDALSNGRLEMTLIGVGFVFLGLFLLFRLSIRNALIAIIPIAVVTFWSSALMFLLGIKFNPMTVTLGALILGIGCEYTILLMMRYYEERGKAKAPAEAMVDAVASIGRAIIASALTTIGGFTALLAAGDFPVVRDFGIITVLDIFLALISTLVLMPALIVSIDSWREKRRLSSARRGT